MSNIKPSDHGIVVENKQSGVRYATSDINYNPKTDRKIRDLRAGESVLSYRPKATNNGSSEDDVEDPDTLDISSGGGE